MVKITNVKVYDLRESVIACRNAFRTEQVKYTDKEFEQSLPRAIQLANTPSGSGHSNFLKGIRVSFDIKYPNYFSPELQRYNFVDIVSSSSKMHRLMEMDLDMACNEWVPQYFIDGMKKLVNKYKAIKCLDNNDYVPQTFTLRNGKVKVAKNKKMALYYAFMECINACPQGIELFMRCSTNYLQLRTIYKQRLHHKLIDDWGVGFCQDFIEKLPYFNEFISGNYEK